jgi:hypothetical protein
MPEEAPPPKPEEAESEGKPAANVATFVQGQVASILGKKVVGPDEKQIMGTIVDLLVDDEGKPRAAVIDLGGFLGVGSRRVAIDWQLFKFRASKPDAPAVLNLDPADLKAAPEYKNVNAAAQVIEPPNPPPAEAAPSAAAPAEPVPAADSGLPPASSPAASSEIPAQLPSSQSPPPQPLPAQPSPPQPSPPQPPSPEPAPSEPAPSEPAPVQASPQSPSTEPPPANHAGQ